MTEDLFLKYLRKDLKPYVKESDCCEGIVELRKEIARLEEENERYRIVLNEMAMIICKAIEYIEDNLYPVGNDVNGSDLPYDEAIQPLVDILKGVDKE